MIYIWADICPYCNKVKALLKALNHPFDVVEVNPSSKREIKDLDSSLKSVPVLQSGDTIIGDSNEILDHLELFWDSNKMTKLFEVVMKWSNKDYNTVLLANLLVEKPVIIAWNHNKKEEIWNGKSHK